MKARPGRWEMLWRTEDALRSHGFDAKVQFPGYIEIKNHNHVYAPGGGFWHHQRDKVKSWTRLDVREDWRDAEQLLTASSRICLRRRNLPNIGHPEIFEGRDPTFTTPRWGTLRATGSAALLIFNDAVAHL